jgi:1-pyrroline-5-carboxylate dehydrogenase
MSNGVFQIPLPKNEPVLGYAPGSKEKNLLLKEIDRQYNNKIEIPLIIGGSEIKTGKTGKCICPHEHAHVLAEYHKAGENEINLAIESALKAKKEWESLHWCDRAAIFMKAAELISTKYRYILNASTMLNQSKNPVQAELDAACELADFLRFNAYYMQQIYSEQPMHNPDGTWNRLEYRPLEGFIFAVTPFNFTAIAGNLPSSPAMMGNTVVWKPASTAVLSAYYIMRLFQEAGLPDGVINFIPGSGSSIGDKVLNHPRLSGVHFTGSTGVFHQMWKTIGGNIEKYKDYPRIVGETGGKDFVFMHNSADTTQVAVALVRGSYEYQGQKCSAASRAYIPESKWPDLKDKLNILIEDIKKNTGSTQDFKFFNAIIDESSFDGTMKYIDEARNSPDAEVIFGGNGDKSEGYFIEPTVILARDPHFVTMEEELFAPVLTIYVYQDAKFEETLDICDQTSPYALTGAIFARDRKIVELASNKLKNAAGNFYINDKPTGSVVGQQPFGGGRASGTNDKAGFYTNLLRWASPRTIKENFVPPEDYRYPFMESENPLRALMARIS